MIFDLISNSARKYANRPFPYIYVALVRFLAVAITAFSALAVMLLLILALTTFGIMNSIGLPLVALVSLAAFVFFAYFWAAYKGAMIKSMMDAEISQPHAHDYLRYALDKGMRYFQIFAIKNAVLFVANLPMTLVFLLAKPDLGSPLGIILILLHLGVSFACKFAFSFVYIAGVVRELPALDAIRNGLTFVARNFVRVFAVYAMYAVMWATLLIPLVNIFTFVSLYPTMYIIMINLYKSRS